MIVTDVEDDILSHSGEGAISVEGALATFKIMVLPFYSHTRIIGLECAKTSVQNIPRGYGSQAGFSAWFKAIKSFKFNQFSWSHQYC